VGGITTPKSQEPPVVGQRVESVDTNNSAGEAKSAEHRRFAQRGRPKGCKAEPATGKARKVKISLYLSESLVNDLYDWAHEDRIHPGEMFDRALRQFHERDETPEFRKGVIPEFRYY